MIKFMFFILSWIYCCRPWKRGQRSKNSIIVNLRYAFLNFTKTLLTMLIQYWIIFYREEMRMRRFNISLLDTTNFWRLWIACCSKIISRQFVIECTIRVRPMEQQWPKLIWTTIQLRSLFSVAHIYPSGLKEKLFVSCNPTLKSYYSKQSLP